MASRRESSTKRASLVVGMPDQRDSYPPIEDYALVGDCGSAALVSTHGSIDWLCWPRFDSPSLFAALLDPKRGGRFQICPTEPYSVDRRYLEGTTVLETTFTTESGVLRLLDLMPVAEWEAYRRTFWPNHETLRRVECVEGTVTVNVHYAPRPDYGRMRPQLTPRDELGVFCTHRGHVFVLRSEVSCTLSDDRQTLSATATLREGEPRRRSPSPERMLSVKSTLKSAISASSCIIRSWGCTATRPSTPVPVRNPAIRNSTALESTLRCAYSDSRTAATNITA